MNRLIITEKNSTAKRITDILSNKDYKTRRLENINVYSFSTKEGYNVDVIGLKGHILRLKFPDDKNNWSDIPPEDLLWSDIEKKPISEKYIKALQKLGKDADEVIIATDYDREGELIGVEALDVILDVNKNIRIKRAKYSAITEEEIIKSFSNLLDMDYNLANSANVRSIIDLIWGASLTRFLSLSAKRLGNSYLSVGRVQTPTLALIKRKDDEIYNFVPEPYLEIYAECLKNGEKFLAKHKKNRFKDENEAKKIEKVITKVKKGVVTEIEKNIIKTDPPLPFNTTSFLKAVSSIGFTVSKAMDIAEKLYNRGLISYPRTDNTSYAGIEIEKILGMLSKSDEFSSCAKELLDKKIDTTLIKRGKQTKDHPSIHPVRYERLKDQDWKIYELITRRFLASLYDRSTMENTKVEIDINGEIFRANGSKFLDKGWRSVYYYKNIQEVVLPKLIKKDRVIVCNIKLEKKKTNPPHRYSQGKLIQKMETLGLGTKSTRHDIIRKLYTRGYVYDNPLKSTKIAKTVIETLEKYAPDITKVDMTSKLEEDMYSIAEGKIPGEDVINESRDLLSEIFERLRDNEKDISKELYDKIKGDKIIGRCEKCGGDLVIIRSRRGTRFVGCSRYPVCDFSLPLPKKGRLVITNELCKEHGIKLLKVLYNKKIWNYGCPYCNYIEWMNKNEEYSTNFI
ncbi:DNA topoisomerase I [Candidatus Methanoliparum sp. LAM-1]|uniref:DNA topoisomerase I n=1 Tax=Candidatus Methanoliparum sp. LAM-1 TaxID=2874846 RepID=UPI001E569A91|nr:DNA topoisomerase I [Candidatus Methanoliparum sp. LAM-1]BDC35372.1 DNA topoisomerase I [Candidatus Methanoliparum sp. LAM-1]